MQNPSVDFYFEKAGQWKPEFIKLRTIALQCGMMEELKWGHPCYTSQKRNIVLMHGFKDYCALLFFNGALLADENHILVQQTANVQAARQIRFSNLKEIENQESVIRSYIFEAIELEKSGIKLPLKKTQEYDVIPEFQVRLDNDPQLKTAFEALTPGRQRGYLLYFASVKQSKTREARIEKYIPHILNGKGLED